MNVPLFGKFKLFFFLIGCEFFYSPFLYAFSLSKQIRLMDCYSAGKDGCGYVLWLTCKADIPEMHDVKGSTPIWCNRE